jgi:hypothetical protein
MTVSRNSRDAIMQINLTFSSIILLHFQSDLIIINLSSKLDQIFHK